MTAQGAVLTGDAQTRLGDLVSRPPVVVDPQATLRAAARTMDSHQVGSVVVLGDDGMARGILTERDLLRVVAHDLDLDRVVVEDEMTSPVLTAGVTWEVYEAAAEMTDRHIRHLVVVDGTEVVGVVSIRDLLLAGQRVDLGGGHWVVLRDPLTLTIRERRRLQRQLLSLSAGPSSDVDVDGLAPIVIGAWSLDRPVPEDSSALARLPDPCLARLRDAVREELPTLTRAVHPAPGWRRWQDG